MRATPLRTIHRCLFTQAQSIPPRSQRHKVSIGIAFAAGAAVYFFLPDSSRASPRKIPLSPSHFTPATVLSNESSGTDSKLLELAISTDLLPPRDTFASIWSVFIKDDDIQVERPYTPLEGVDDNGRMRFWIKKYEKGEVGRWLHSKSPGDHIELRGPLQTWPWKEDTWDEVVMISGGTGITPFYQLFHHIISRTNLSPSTKFTLIHSSRNPEQLPPPALLQPLQAFAQDNPGRFNVHFFVDSATPVDSRPTPKFQVGRISQLGLEKCLGVVKKKPPLWQRMLLRSAPDPAPRKTLFLVCGPEPMINAISGPYGRNFSQGVVGGILGNMGYTSSQVYKL